MFKKIIAHHNFRTGKPCPGHSGGLDSTDLNSYVEDGQMVLPFFAEEQNTQLVIHGIHDNDAGDAAITVINNDTTIRNLTVTDYLNTPNGVGDVTYDIELGCLKTWNGMEWVVI